MIMHGTKEFWYDWMGANDVLFEGINNIRGADYDKVMRIVSWLGDHDRFVLYLLILAGFAVLTTGFKLLFNRPGKWFYASSWLGVFLVLVISYGATGLGTRMLKDTFELPRPYVALGRDNVNVLEATPPQNDFRSFPSGHMVFTLLMVIGLSPVLSTTLNTLAVPFVLLMAWSRISLGMHFPADVFYTTLIAAPCIMYIRNLIYKIMRSWFRIKC